MTASARNTEGIRILSLNIERLKHESLTLPFLREQAAAKVDALLLQEVRVCDLEKLYRVLPGYVCVTVPMGYHPGDHGDGPHQVVLANFTRLSFISYRAAYYAGSQELAENPHYVHRRLPSKVLLGFDLFNADSECFCLINTHFTWSADGLPSHEQWVDMIRFRRQLEHCGDFVLCGDLNIPRNVPESARLRAELTEKLLIDHVPPQHTTSLDPNLHRVKNLERMVDTVMSTGGYRVFDVQLHFGVSDHAAITCCVQIAA